MNTKEKPKVEGKSYHFTVQKNYPESSRYEIEKADTGLLSNLFGKLRMKK